MFTVHPAFDIKTKTWFVDQFEASTLKALKAILPPRTKIEGYHPHGYTAVRTMSTEQRTYMPVKSSFHMQSKSSPPTPIKPAISDKPQPSPPSPITQDAILDDWAAGMSGQAIADKYGILNPRSVMKRIMLIRLTHAPTSAILR